jgi:hypothetical protein
MGIFTDSSTFSLRTFVIEAEPTGSSSASVPAAASLLMSSTVLSGLYWSSSVFNAIFCPRTPPRAFAASSATRMPRL